METESQLLPGPISAELRRSAGDSFLPMNNPWAARSVLAPMASVTLIGPVASERVERPPATSRVVPGP